ncbi:hypothetical protein [Chitinophaga barathri]|uniref:Uncharacterized protein n=1 Tax=Chitinophaga barathri TaxID=1647451 RepID=A0A3N4M4T7_9BACT|nr:hypothetical protein [Chitinophaga barathri]RPD37885.1 hypothetical protein EG028_27785 [Chitinophaga barathri]
METKKIIIEIPIGMPVETRDRLVKLALSLIGKTVFPQRLAKAEEILRNSVWPSNLEELLAGKAST